MTLQTTIYMCIAGLINALALLVYAPLLDGIGRKIKARIQRRKGPSVMQTIYDLRKLYGIRAIIDGLAGNYARYAPALSMALVVMAALMIPSFLPSSTYCDLIVAAYLLIAVTIAQTYASLSMSIPYSVIGGCREASIMMASELCFAGAIASIAAAYGTLYLWRASPIIRLEPLKPSMIIAAGVLFIIAYVESMNLPFEISEAEPELAGGTMIGYGGRSLALVMHSAMIRKTLFISLVLDLLFPWRALGAGLPGIALRIIVFTVLLTGAYVVMSMLNAVYGRYTPGQALKTLKRVGIASIAAVILASIGY